MKRCTRVLVPALLVALVAIAGCKKKTPPPAAQTAPPVTAPAPTAHISAEPGAISAGDQVTLNWKTTDATSVSIEGIGDVPTSGTKTVTPTASTTYHLVARGEGGTADDTARVTVNAPPPVTQPTNSMSAEEEFKANMQDVFYDYDAYDVRPDSQGILSKDAAYLSSHPNIRIVIGGYCDERGSNEYNLALGQNRADAAKNALISAGIAAARIRVVSYGKEKPFCSESTEACWQQNRRAGFSLDQ
ncbi:peptidoglycan-associated lipoprotein Pal [Telmatobacter sp. DSM 110680]|uniref:Peptidoglycan-associated lipoprotein n=1 Tax=Telmatobacter sp. DSM 110680 TaxID=3036704 RepID=A0AAU7DFH1_9BACT